VGLIITPLEDDCRELELDSAEGCAYSRRCQKGFVRGIASEEEPRDQDEL
jgi:hypothetical protein